MDLMARDIFEGESILCGAKRRDVDALSQPTRAKQQVKASTGSSGETKRSEMGFLHAMFEQMPAGVLVIDPASGGVRSGNHELERLFGQPMQEIVSSSEPYHLRFVHPDGTAFNADETPVTRAIASGVTVVDDALRVRRADGSLVDVSVTAWPVYGQQGELLAGVSIIEDVSVAIEAERARTRLLTTELLSSATSDALERLREIFIVHASHELRTPLTTIKGFTQLLDRRLHRSELDRSGLLRATNEIAVQVERMQQLIADLFHAIALPSSSPDPPYRPCDVSEVARRVVARFERSPERSERHTLVIQTPTPVLAACHPHHVDQILSSLVSNALRFSPDGGTVRVTAARVAGWAELSVEDEGVGLSFADQARLWRPILSSRHREPDVSSVGLGFSIVRQLVDMNDGSITVSSEAGVGSRIVVRLPLEPKVDQTVSD